MQDIFTKRIHRSIRFSCTKSQKIQNIYIDFLAVFPLHTDRIRSHPSTTIPKDDKRKMYFYYIEVTRPNGLGINNTYKIPSETNVNSFRPSLILKTSTFVLSYGKPFSFQVELVAKHSHANGTKKQRKIENGNELEQMKWLRFHHFNIIHVFVRHIWTEVFTVAQERWIIGKFWLLFRLCFVFVPISFSVFQSSSDVSGALYFLCTN